MHENKTPPKLNEPILPEVCIDSKPTWFNIDLREIWRYRDLIAIFVWRDVIAGQKQTLLGPAWYVITPVATSIVFALIFGKFIGINTLGTPSLLFFMSGVTIWNFFSQTFIANSATFTNNQALFSKVYFPRLIVPISQVISSAIKFHIQLAVLFAFIAYFSIFRSFEFSIGPHTLVAIPTYLAIAVFAFALSLIISSLTVRFRDLTFLTSLGLQFFMYWSPVLYPSSRVPAELQFFLFLNPLASLIDLFRHAIFLTPAPTVIQIAYSLTVISACLFISVIMFCRTERNFLDIA